MKKNKKIVLAACLMVVLAIFGSIIIGQVWKKRHQVVDGFSVIEDSGLIADTGLGVDTGATDNSGLIGDSSLLEDSSGIGDFEENGRLDGVDQSQDDMSSENMMAEDNIANKLNGNNTNVDADIDNDKVDDQLENIGGITQGQQSEDFNGNTDAGTSNGKPPKQDEVNEVPNQEGNKESSGTITKPGNDQGSNNSQGSKPNNNSTNKPTGKPNSNSQPEDKPNTSNPPSADLKPEKKPIGNVTFTLDAQVIGLGNLISNLTVDLYEGETAAHIVDRALKENGYTYLNTGSLDSNFYLSAVQKSNMVRNPQILERVKAILEDEDMKLSIDKCQPDSLREFDFTKYSGWRYRVNGIAPNVGMSDYKIHVNDKIVLRYTLCLGYDDEV